MGSLSSTTLRPGLRAPALTTRQQPPPGQAAPRGPAGAAAPRRGVARAPGAPGGLGGRWRTALSSLTPWAEEDPDPEPYLLRRRRGTAAPPKPQQQQRRGDRYAWPDPAQDDSSPSAPPLPYGNQPANPFPQVHGAPPPDWAPPPVQGLGAEEAGGAGEHPPGTPLAVVLAKRAVWDLAVPAAGGAVVGYGLGLAVPQLGLAAAAGVATRALIKLFAQTVPFTGRRHNLLLPLSLELAMGESSFRSFLAQQRKAGKILSRRSRDHLLVAEVANQVVATAMRGHGGGSQDHLKKFKWEVVTVQDDTANAFVLPGGKVVVYTGLLDVLGRRRPLLATVLGHEVAHAMARHSAEKMTLGIFAALALRVLASAATRAAADGSGEARRLQEQERQRELERRRRAQGGGGGWWPAAGQGQQAGRRQAPLFFGGAAGGSGDEPGELDSPDYGLGPGSPVAQLLEAAGGSAQAAAREYARHAASAAYGGAPGLSAAPLPGSSPLRSPQVVELLNSVLLQLPFSRRAEAEADLIGLKLMALSGYDPAQAPDTFRRLEAAEHGKGRSPLAAIASPVARAATLGCTHPRSANRVRALEEEVAAMQEAGPAGYESVYTHPGYWSL